MLSTAILKNQRSIVFAMVLLVTCLAHFRSEAATHIIYAYNNEFSINLPGEPIEQAIITEGDEILWQWIQGGHTTTSVAGSTEVWDSILDSGTPTFSYTFNTAGVYWFYCQPHGSDDGDGTASGMSGYITVLPAGDGACCLLDGTCYQTNAADCLTQGGDFQGIGSDCGSVQCGTVIDLPALKDIALYEISPEVSNALGDFIYTGQTNQGERRRGLFSFDLTSIPQNSLIISVELQIYCNDAAGGAQDHSLHLLSSDWGEGTSNDNGQETDGTAPTTGDATWLHSFFDTQLWTTPGGDFDAVASATTPVDIAGQFYTWSSLQMAADVQGVIDAGASFFGWALLGDENSALNTKRFSSKDSPDPLLHPVLTITYSELPTGACCLPDGSCYVTTEIDCNGQSGVYHGDNSLCEDIYCSPVLTPFIDPLPLPSVAVPTSGTAGGQAHYNIAMTEQFQTLHSELPPTRVWGYNGSYPGPTIEAYRGDTVFVDWLNDIRVAETNELRTVHPLWVDTCLHGPHETGQSPVAIVHLHGAVVAPESDGNPEWAYPPGETSPTYVYPNDQPASTIWYHDHALGITRLNVMMGLAGFYLIRDDIEQSLNLPSGQYEIPLAIQDRKFNADGSIEYPEMWDEHFFGDKVLVNGKVWPYLEVDQGKYRFRVLNGSNSRTYRIALSDGAPFWQIGTDLGLIEAPLELTEIVLTPGERAELIMDFSGYAPGTEIIMTNDAPAPYPGFAGVGVIPEIMKFIVTSNPGFNGPLPVTMASVPITPIEDAVLERDMNLVKMAPMECGNHTHGMWSINGLMWDDITDYPVLGTTEIWSWINTSGMSHPMHMHLVKFQVIDRIPVDINGNEIGPPEAPEPFEMGWKDTVNATPGYKTRVIAKFEGYTGLYPFHCHILEHEDHEMMRQFLVVSPEVFGCTDPTACNYDPTATADDGSCLQLDECGNCGGTDIAGCIDPTACNYDMNAACDDGSCEFESCAGCTDPTACNYDPAATIDDGSCLQLDECGNCGGTDTAGCTDPTACNYDMNAGCDDGSCEFDSCAGCTDPTACNYDPAATADDGTCYYNCAACDADLNGDGEVSTPDILNLLSIFGCMPPGDCASGDINGDGYSNVADLLILLGAFGLTCDGVN